METSPAQTPSTALSQSVPRHALDKELAVARLFLRTKPSDVSCREYAEELRAARTRVDSPMASPSSTCTDAPIPLEQGKFTIDSGTFWRNRAARLLEAKQALSEDNERLEAESIQLKLRIKSLESTIVEQKALLAGSSSKRKRSVSSKTEKIDQTPATNKRPRLEEIIPLADDTVQCSIMETPQGQKANQALLIAVYSLQVQLQSTLNKKDRSSLARSIERTAKALIRMLDNSPQSEDWTEYARAIKATLGLVFHATVVFDKPSGESHNSCLVFSLVKLFRTMLCLLWDCSSARTSTPIPVSTHKARRVCRPRSGKSQVQTSVTTKSKTQNVDFQERKELLRTFIAFAASHTLNSPTVAELAEGMLFLLMQRAGPLMYAISFDEAGCSWGKGIEDQIRDASILYSGPDTAEAKGDRDVKARVLMPLMKQTLSAYLANPRSRRMYQGSVHLPEEVQNSLMACERSKIQNTLKQAIFPQKDSEFGEGVKSAKEVLRMMEQEERDEWSDKDDVEELKRDGTWFVEDLWTLVGWDVMVDYWRDE